MKTKLFLLVLIAVLVMVVPAYANGNEAVGERINLASGLTQTFPAGEPFHIRHGWGSYPPVLTSTPPTPLGRFTFELEVDGVYQKADFFQVEIDHSQDVWMVRQRLYNFPEGMTGEHVFTGHWLSACAWAVYSGNYPGPCPTPNAMVEVSTLEVNVTFTP